MKKSASGLNKTAIVILLIFSAAFFLYGIYMVMYSVRYIQEYDSMAGTVDAARYVISACASYFGFALTLAAGALCLVNLSSVSYGTDATYRDKIFPDRDDPAVVPPADPVTPATGTSVATGSDQSNAPGHIEISAILSETEETENGGISEPLSEALTEHAADTDNENVEDVPVTVPEDEPAQAQDTADEDSVTDITESIVSVAPADAAEEQTASDEKEKGAVVYHERISSSMIKDIFEGR